MLIELTSVLNSCDTLQGNASVCDTFWRLTDFQDLGANRVKPCFYLLGPTQYHSISLRHYLDIHRLPGFRCQYSLTCFTTCAECSNKTLILIYTHIYIHADRHTYIHTLVSARMYACMHGHIRANMRKSKLEIRNGPTRRLA